MHSSDDVFNWAESSADLSEVINVLQIPFAIADNEFKIRWYSNSFKKIIDADIGGTDLTKTLNIPKGELDKKVTSIFENLFYKIMITKLQKDDKNTYVIFLNAHNSPSEKINKRLSNIKNFAHDLNNILTSIASSSTLLKQNLEANSKVLSLIETIETNSNRAAEIVERVLCGDDNLPSMKKKLNVKILLNDLHKTVLNIIRDEIEIKVNCDEDVNFINGNYSELFRVFLNLCVNASEAIRRKGSITVSACNVNREADEFLTKSKYRNYVRITVKDTGVGIRRRYINKIFDSHFSTKNKKRESGLGLNIVKKIIHDHEGMIDVKSKWHRGTEFKIYLPAKSVLSEYTDLSEFGGKKIVVADDEKTILELLTDLLKSYNYEVLDACDGEEVIRLVKKHTDIDLFIIDRKMPGMGGLECIRILREMEFKQPIIITSGSKSLYEDESINTLNIDKIMIKPYDFEELLSVVKELVI